MRKVLFFLAIAPVYLISMLPLGFHYFMSGIIAFFLDKVIGYRRSVITVNVSRAFPEFRYDKIEKITKRFYKNFADIIAESIKDFSLSTKQISRMAYIKNPQIMKKYYDRGLSVIIVGGHIGNWELLGKIEHFANSELTGYTGKHTNFVYKKQRSKLADDIIMWVRSKNSDVNLIESKSVARTILRNREQLGCYFLLADQAPNKGSNFSISFLNQPTFMINGPEAISRAVGFPVVYLEMIRERRGKYVVNLQEITDNPAECEPGYITRTYAKLLENSIQKNPDNWLWSHKKWKREVEKRGEA